MPVLEAPAPSPPLPPSLCHCRRRIAIAPCRAGTPPRWPGVQAVAVAKCMHMCSLPCPCFYKALPGMHAATARQASAHIRPAHLMSTQLRPHVHALLARWRLWDPPGAQQRACWSWALPPYPQAHCPVARCRCPAARCRRPAGVLALLTALRLRHGRRAQSIGSRRWQRACLGCCQSCFARRAPTHAATDGRARAPSRQQCMDAALSSQQQRRLDLLLARSGRCMVAVWHTAWPARGDA